MNTYNLQMHYLLTHYSSNQIDFFKHPIAPVRDPKSYTICFTFFVVVLSQYVAFRINRGILAVCLEMSRKLNNSDILFRCQYYQLYGCCYCRHRRRCVTSAMVSLIKNCIPKNTWWRHQMETFSALLALCVGSSPVTGDAELWCFFRSAMASL